MNSFQRFSIDEVGETVSNKGVSYRIDSSYRHRKSEKEEKYNTKNN
jgi:hypothetical protein